MRTETNKKSSVKANRSQPIAKAALGGKNSKAVASTRPLKPQSSVKTTKLGTLKTKPSPKYPFFERIGIEKLAAEQGVKPFNFEQAFGAGRKLWKDEKDFEEFMRSIGRPIDAGS